MEVLVFGSAIVDFICYVDRLPKAGETLHGTKFATGFGGKGANQCVSAARLGARTAMICKLGKDDWGCNYIAHLKKEGINVAFVELCDGETTGIAQIAVGANGENNIIIVAGANNLLVAADVEKAKEIFEESKILICQLETPLEATLTALRQFKGVSILNAAPAVANAPRELIEAASILCVNETEASLMVGGLEIKNLMEAKMAAVELTNMGAKTVIITLGAMGAVCCNQENPSVCIHVPAPMVATPVDTTGAGDAFIGALAFSIARYPHLELPQHIDTACKVAAYSVQRTGTQSSFPNAEQINVRPHTNECEWKQL